jgi:hypothetical protein
MGRSDWQHATFLLMVTKVRNPLPSRSTISRTEASKRARISELTFARARWTEILDWMLLVGAALCIALVAMLSGSAHAGVVLEERKLPMKFTWVDCQPNCRGWVSAVGVVTANTPTDFDEFARGRQLGGTTIVLDSSGGSVNDAIALGRRWRNLGALTTVGTSVQTNTAQWEPANMAPVAYCESMCVFLLLSGKTRYVPETAHVRVHQIWMGDRANAADCWARHPQRRGGRADLQTSMGSLRKVRKPAVTHALRRARDNVEAYGSLTDSNE